MVPVCEEAVMASAERIRRFWDASCFLALLNDEAGAEDCEQILEQAKQSRTDVYVSPVVQVEVVRPRRSPSPVPQEARDRIREFFENDYIKWRMIDRNIANESQRLCWDYNLHPRDAIHLAVALDLRCDLLETFDGDLLKWESRISPGSPSIRKPRWIGQPPLL